MDTWKNEHNHCLISCSLFLVSTAFDSSLLSNIQKLFSERIEIFSSVEFSKVSVLTGIVKIGLKVRLTVGVSSSILTTCFPLRKPFLLTYFKTLLECVRLRTFGKYGLQQIQVDTHYLAFYFTNRFCLLMDFKCCFILRLFWSVYDFGRLENMVYSRSKLTRTTCRCTYGDLYPMRSKGNLYIYACLV